MDDNPSFEQQFELDNQNPLPTNEKKIKPKVLTQLSQATAQLAQARIKKLREDLDQQRLKVTTQKSNSQPSVNKPVPKDNAVQNTLKASKETGEFKGLVGG